MKKLMIALMLLVVSFAFIPKTYATQTPGDDYFLKTEWELVQLSGTYYVQTDFIMIEHDVLNIYLSTYGSLLYTEQQLFVEGVHSRVDVFQTLGLIPTYNFYLEYEPGATETLVAYDELDNLLNFGDYMNMYFKLRLQLSSSLTASQRAHVVYTLNYEKSAFDFTMDSYNDIQNPLTVADLPLTEGTPFEQTDAYSVDYNKYGEVHFSYLNGDVTLWITYFGFYSIVLEDVVFSDDSFLENVQDVYYYTEGIERFLYFAYGDNDDFVLTDGNIQAKTWTGFTVWNLTTNEVVTTQRAWALTYIDVVDLNAYAYFYMPYIPTDDLLSVSVTFTYRIGRQGITTLFQQQYEEWQTKSVILEKDQVTSSVPQWTYDLYYASAGAIVLGSILSISTGTTIGMPLIYAGSIAAATSFVNSKIELYVNNIDQLEKLNYPSSALVSTINAHYTEISGQPINISGQPVYKMHLGSFTGLDHNYVEFDTNDDKYKYTEVVWTTDGTVYTISEDYIDNDVIVDQDYVAIRPEETTLDLMGMLMLPGITILFAMVGWRTKFKNVGHVVLFVALYVAILFLVGAL